MCAVLGQGPGRWEVLWEVFVGGFSEVRAQGPGIPPRQGLKRPLGPEQLGEGLGLLFTNGTAIPYRSSDVVVNKATRCRPVQVRR